MEKYIIPHSRQKFLEKWQGVPKSCEHAPVEKNSETSDWIYEGTSAYSKLETIVLNKNFMKDWALLFEVRHTGSLKIYHSLITKYCHKDFTSSLHQLLPVVNWRLWIIIMVYLEEDKRAQKMENYDITLSSQSKYRIEGHFLFIIRRTKPILFACSRVWFRFTWIKKN